MVATVPSMRAHSWSFVYSKSFGYEPDISVSSPSSASALIKRTFDYLGLDELATAINEEPGARFGLRRGDVAQADVLSHRGPGGPRGHLADARARLVDEGVSLARATPAHHHEARQLARRTLGAQH